MRIFISLFLLVNFVCAQTYGAEEDPSVICSPTECYKVLKKLGRGAFGAVYSVEDSTEKKFAIKRYHRDDYSSSLLNDFQREFNNGQLFDHPNIIRSVDVFKEESPQGATNNLLIDLVAGKVLGNIAKKSISTEEALQATFEFTDALRHAFSMGYLYLDLHQGNVMLDDESRIKIIDLASFFSWDELLKWNDGYDSLYGKKIAENGDPLRKKKIDQFVLNHPRLHALIKELQLNSHAFLPKGTNSDMNSTKDYRTQIKLEWFLSYLDAISEFYRAINIKSKSDLETSMQLYYETKKIAWILEEDIASGNTIQPLELYFDQLLTVLEKRIMTIKDAKDKL